MDDSSNQERDFMEAELNPNAIGYEAMMSTPLPEPRCGQYPICCDGSEHDPQCECHPRNALVKVLPGWLAKCETKPDGLEWANAKLCDWEPCPLSWGEGLPPTRLFAYSVPFHVWQKVEAERKAEPQTVLGSLEADNQEARAIVHQAVQSDLTRAAGPTDGEILVWEEAFLKRAGAQIIAPWRAASGGVWSLEMSHGLYADVLAEGPTLRAALTSAMQKEGTK
jgi:hypothetical protein